MDILLLFRIFVLVGLAFTSDAYKCYECVRSTSNSECLTSYTECETGQACESSHILKRIGNESRYMTAIQKRCVNVCKNPGVNVCFGRESCRYCCYGDLCNDGITFRQKAFAAAKPFETVTRKTTPNPVERENSECPVCPAGPAGPPGSPGPSGQRGVPGKPGSKGSHESTPLVAFSGSATGLRQKEAYIRLVEFDEIITDFGNLRRSTKGPQDKLAIFSIKQAGLYMFHLNSVAYGSNACPVLLKHNNDFVVLRSGRADIDFSASPLGVGHALLKLDVNDELALYVEPIPRRYVKDITEKYSSPSHITFSAYLVHPL